MTWVPFGPNRVRMHSKSQKKPAPTSSGGHDARRSSHAAARDDDAPRRSPRLLRMDVHEAFRVANKRRGDFVKAGQRVVSAWAPRDEREFWSRRSSAIGPAGTVRRVVPARAAAEGELDGLCCTERYWLPLHALEKASCDEEGSDVLAVREDCLLYTSPSPRDRTRSRMPSSA